MHAHAVPGRDGGADEAGALRGSLAEEEEDGAGVVRGEAVEERGVCLARPVVERKVEAGRAVGVPRRSACDDAGEERRRDAGEVVEGTVNGRKGEGGWKLHCAPSPFPPLPLS